MIVASALIHLQVWRITDHVSLLTYHFPAPHPRPLPRRNFLSYFPGGGVNFSSVWAGAFLRKKFRSSTSNTVT